MSYCGTVGQIPNAKDAENIPCRNCCAFLSEDSNFCNMCGERRVVGFQDTRKVVETHVVAEYTEQLPTRAYLRRLPGPPANFWDLPERPKAMDDGEQRAFKEFWGRLQGRQEQSHALPMALRPHCYGNRHIWYSWQVPVPETNTGVMVNSEFATPQWGGDLCFFESDEAIRNRNWRQFPAGISREAKRHWTSAGAVGGSGGSQFTAIEVFQSQLVQPNFAGASDLKANMRQENSAPRSEVTKMLYQPLVPDFSKMYRNRQMSVYDGVVIDAAS